MGRHGLYSAIASVLVAAGLALAAFAAPLPRLADKSAGAIPVDVELVIAVDVSYSMDPEEQALQREGYVQALTSREFLQALREGANGKIAITYFEWAGEFDQKIIMPWRLIDGPESADSVAAEIAAAPYRRASRTSISGGLKFAKPLFDHSGYRGLRRVIDVSGDGANNAGALIVPTRDDVLAAGITINGLPIMLKRPVRGQHGYRKPRRLLRRLRDRRAGRLRGADPRAQAVHRGDAQQAGAGNLRPASRSRASFPRRRKRRAFPAPSARRCGGSAGAATIFAESQRWNFATTSTWNE